MASVDVDLEMTLAVLHTNPDAVERFLALYDLYKLMMRGQPTVAEASKINTVFEQMSKQDRDLNVRAWADYFRARIWGKRSQNSKPYLPKLWDLLIVEDI